MRSLASSVQSLNWRLVWIGTFLFMGLYFVAFDNRQLTLEQFEALRKNISLESGGARTTATPKNKAADLRFNEKFHIEDPNPVLGTEYDSPLDAIPGRQRPIFPEDLAKMEQAKKEKEEKEKEEKEEKEKEEQAKKDEKEKILKEMEDQTKENEQSEKSEENKADDDKSKEEKSTDDKSPDEKAEGQKSDEDKPKESGQKGDEAKDDEAKKEGSKGDESKQDPPKDAESKEEKTKDEPERDDKEEKSKEKPSEEKPGDDKPDDQIPKENQDGEISNKGPKGEGKNRDRIIPFDSENYVALCLAVRDQADDLVEFFVHHYKHIGIRRFYIMDDRSRPPLSERKEKWGIPSKHITFEYQEQYERQGFEQIAIYQRCFEHYGAKHTWMGFLDADEFLEMTAGNETLQEMLHELEQIQDVGALAVNWRMHTSSGLEKRPESARKAFVDCIWDDDENGGANSNNTHVKSIVRMSRAGNPVGPHMWYLNDIDGKTSKTVGEHLDHVNSIAFRSPITRDRIALHHYAGKSREEYEAKMLRGNAMNDPKGEFFWNSLNHLLPHVPCPEMAKYDP